MKNRLFSKILSLALAAVLSIGVIATNGVLPVKAEGSLHFEKIHAGENYNIAVTDSGAVYAWGRNYYGQLGLGDTTHRTAPTRVTALDSFNIKEIYAGREHTLAVTDAGAVYAWGRNNYDQLGLGDTTDRTTPTRVTALDSLNIKEISAGYYHNFAVTDAGAVYAWGRNSWGQLGLGDTTNRTTPTRVTALDGLNIKEIVCASGNHTLAVTDTGAVYVWGQNTYGQLGLGNKTYRTIPTRVTALDSLNIREISAGEDHTLAVTDTGAVYAWGRNYYGQLGLGDSGTWTDRTAPTRVTALDSLNIKEIYAGGNHTLAVADTGAVYAWGRNTEGQLGLGNTTNKTKPTRVTALDSLNIKEIHAGYQHTLAVTDSGAVYAWGYNTAGQLGLGDTTQKTSPVLTSFTATPDGGSAPTTPAEAPVAAFPTEISQSPVTVEISYAAGAVQKLYRLQRHENTFAKLLKASGLASTAYAEGDWLDYTGPVTVEYNSTLEAKSIDANGIESEVAFYEITNLNRIESTGRDNVNPLIPIEGTIHATEISVTHPVTLEWMINPNNVGTEFTATPWDITNNSRIKLNMAVTGFELTDVSKTLGFNDVLPTLYTDEQWETLGSDDTASKLALGIKRGETASLWAAELEDSKSFGTVGVAETTTLDFMAKHGLAFNKSQSITHDLTLMFTLS